jgi:hypothetical protein
MIAELFCDKLLLLELLLLVQYRVLQLHIRNILIVLDLISKQHLRSVFSRIKRRQGRLVGHR